tara:strand:+ start:189 stop:515 length:327 start_codon:yes stop_codon:yes gene_type:complete
MKHQSIYLLYSNVVCVNGEGSDTVATDKNGNVVSWDASAVAKKEAELKTAKNLFALRKERNRLLAETDHWALSDTANATSTQIKYRQDLRDITKTAISLDAVTWPGKP